MFKDKIKKRIEKLLWYVMKKYQALTPSPIRIIWLRAAEESADFIEAHAKEALLFFYKKDLWKFALDKVLISKGLFLECGVFRGDSINFMAKIKTDVDFYGFDSFAGTEEDWVGHHKPKGAFDLKGRMPLVESNVHLVQGWVTDTLPKLLEEQQSFISFLHIDTDTYTPAKTILASAKPFLKKGTVIVFDELIGYPGWKAGEYRALEEVLDNDSYEYIAFSNTQAAIQITKDQ